MGWNHQLVSLGTSQHWVLFRKASLKWHWTLMMLLIALHVLEPTSFLSQAFLSCKNKKKHQSERVVPRKFGKFFLLLVQGTWCNAAFNWVYLQLGSIKKGASPLGSDKVILFSWLVSNPCPEERAVDLLDEALGLKDSSAQRRAYIDPKVIEELEGILELEWRGLSALLQLLLSLFWKTLLTDSCLKTLNSSHKSGIQFCDSKKAWWVTWQHEMHSNHSSRQTSPCYFSHLRRTCIAPKTNSFSWMDAL